MVKENTSLEFRVEKIDETRNDLLEEIKLYDLMNKKTRRNLNYF